jgi:hypothetical protein
MKNHQKKQRLTCDSNPSVVTTTTTTREKTSKLWEKIFVVVVAFVAIVVVVAVWDCIAVVSSCLSRQSNLETNGGERAKTKHKRSKKQETRKRQRRTLDRFVTCDLALDPGNGIDDKSDHFCFSKG